MNQSDSTPTFSWHVNHTTYIGVAVEKDGTVAINMNGVLTQSELEECIEILKMCRKDRTPRSNPSNGGDL